MATSVGIGLLEGVDAFTGERKQLCATAKEVKEDTNTHVDLDLSYVSNVEEVYRFIGTNASAKYGVGIGTRVKLTFGMESEHFFSRNAAVLAVAENVTTTSKVAVAPFDLPANLKDSTQTTDDAFRKKCGTDFVSEVIRGGRFIVLLRTVTESEQVKRRLKADATLAFGPASGSAEYNAALHRLANDYSLRVNLVRVGGNGSLPALTPTALMDYARNFPSIVGRSHNVVAVETTPYSAAGRSLDRDLDEDVREHVLFGLASNMDSALELNQRINEILDESPAFSFQKKDAEITGLVNTSKDISEYVSKFVLPAAKSCLDKTKDCALDLLMRRVPRAILPKKLAETGGGCYVWTNDNKYCLDFRLSSSRESPFVFAAQMMPGRTWNVHARGRIYPDMSGPEHFRDVTPAKVAAELMVNGKTANDKKEFHANQDPDWDLGIPALQTAADGVVKGTLAITQCFWVSSKTCPLNRILISITPSEAVAPPRTFIGVQ